MVVLDATSFGGTAALLGGPYAQGAPALKLIPKRYLGVHQWLSPIATKDLKEQIVSRDFSFQHKFQFHSNGKSVMGFTSIYFNMSNGLP